MYNKYPKKKMRVFLLLICILTLLSACGKSITITAGTEAFSMGETKVTLDEMMYHVLLAKMQGELYASFLADENFWEKKDDSGRTMEEQLKQFALDNAIKYEILYQKAMEEGISLTQEELLICQSKAEDVERNIPEDTRAPLGLNTSIISRIQEKIGLATKYYELYLPTLDEDAETAKAVFEERFPALKEEYGVKVNQAAWKAVDIVEPQLFQEEAAKN